MESQEIDITVANIKTEEAIITLGGTAVNALEAARKSGSVHPPRVTFFIDAEGSVRMANPDHVYLLPEAFDIPPERPYTLVRKISEYPTPHWVAVHEGDLWEIKFTEGDHRA